VYRFGGGGGAPISFICRRRRCVLFTGSAVGLPIVEAAEAVASAKIDAAQLKDLLQLTKFHYKLATCFAESLKIIAIIRSAQTV